MSTDHVTRYFDASIEGHLRITVAEGSDREIGDAFRDCEELRESDLPEDFCSWRVYNQGAGFDFGFRTLSRQGD